MSFYKQLVIRTEQARQDFMQDTQIIHRCLAGDVTLDEYIGFLTQAYHHVKHTVPLLMAMGSRVDGDREWLRNAIAEYIEEELGHQEWVLDDIAACGASREAAQDSQPLVETEIMVAFAYDMIQRRSPTGFLGMVHVLEGTSVSLADRAANCIRNTLNLPETAFRYLTSHGSIDQSHVRFFENIINRIENQDEQDTIVHSTRVFYRLYGDIFRALDTRKTQSLSATGGML